MEEKMDHLSLEEDQNIMKLLNPDDQLKFSDKVLKFNDRDWKQERILIITNENILNLKRKVLKRAIKLEAVTAITKSKSPESHEFVIHVPSQYDYRFDSERREQIITIIKEVYFKLHKTNLPVYGVHHHYLKDFCTSKKDSKKHKYKAPEEAFRLHEEDLVHDDTEDGMMERKRSRTIYARDDSKLTLDDFKLIKVVGKGSFGKVYLVEKKIIEPDEEKILYAMKVLRKDVLIDSDQIENTKLERDILKTVNHPFLVSMEFVFQTSDRIYFVMKFMRGGEMFTHLSKERRFSETRTKFYAAQIALALGHLHSKKIIYRDIKPENILMDEYGYICLADFGLAKILEDEKATMSFCGTPEYLAPEIITGEGHNRMVDWWSLGVLIYEMMVGIPPFYHQNTHFMYQYITTKTIIFPDPKKYNIHISDAAKDIIVKLLNKNQKIRLGVINDLEEIMSHPFFKDIDLDQLMNREITPEFVPVIKDKYDVSCFDTNFTSEPLVGSNISPSKLDFIKKFEAEFKDFA